MQRPFTGLPFPVLTARWMPMRLARMVCVPAVLVGGLLYAACVIHATGPEACTSTCIVVNNQSTLPIRDVRFRRCTDAVWSGNRLVVRPHYWLGPGDQEEWTVAAGCWDILVQGSNGGLVQTHFENDVEIRSGERHVCSVTF
jgi:hypothetical protein